MAEIQPRVGRIPTAGRLIDRSLGSALSSLARAEERTIDLSRDLVIASLPAGSGRGQVGVAGTPPVGPQALAVTPDGKVHVLDSVNQRVITDGSGNADDETAIPTSFARDLLFTPGGGMVVLGSDEVIALRAGGAIERRIPLARGFSAGVTGLARDVGNDVLVEYEADHRFALIQGGAPVPLNMQGNLSMRREGLTGDGSALAFAARYSSQEPHYRSAALEVVAGDALGRHLPIQAAGGVGAVQVVGADRGGRTCVLVTEPLSTNEVRVGLPAHPRPSPLPKGQR